MSANLVSCPDDALPTALTALLALFGLPDALQATIPPSNPLAGR
jgi:hypothetical protein